MGVLMGVTMGVEMGPNSVETLCSNYFEQLLSPAHAQFSTLRIWGLTTTGPKSIFILLTQNRFYIFL